MAPKVPVSDKTTTSTNDFRAHSGGREVSVQKEEASECSPLSGFSAD